jgi:hypothetical protein
MYKGNKTITTIFCVPLLGIGRGLLKQNGFIDAYVDDKITNPNFDDAIYLLFRPEYPSRFRKFLNHEYLRSKLILDDYDIKDGFCIVVYRPASSHSKDIELVKQGKYSKVSKDFQSFFPFYVEIEKDGIIRKEKSLQQRVFNKDTSLLDYCITNNIQNYIKNDEYWYSYDVMNDSLTEDVLSNFNKERIKG